MTVSDFSVQGSHLSSEVASEYRICARTSYSPTVSYEDNTACMEGENNVDCESEHAMHIDIHKLFANDAIKNGQLTLI